MSEAQGSASCGDYLLEHPLGALRAGLRVESLVVRCRHAAIIGPSEGLIESHDGQPNPVKVLIVIV